MYGIPAQGVHTRSAPRAPTPHPQEPVQSAALSLGGRGRAPITCLAAASGVVLAAPRLPHYHLLALQAVSWLRGLESGVAVHTPVADYVQMPNEYASLVLGWGHCGLRRYRQSGTLPHTPVPAVLHLLH